MAQAFKCDGCGRLLSDSLQFAKRGQPILDARRAFLHEGPTNQKAFALVMSVTIDMDHIDLCENCANDLYDQAVEYLKTLRAGGYTKIQEAVK
jgi:hypothetical protein